ncbi:zinc finger protein [Nephila pilipes]|uniref:Zinc finger protein n=1 Tax=Nephila pilipes TaxID=299642 RepID=A0A8X6PFB1_NEPPI|nr:zinc finger protein [Nephila pilipes]
MGRRVIVGYYGRLVCTTCGKVFTTGSTLSRHRLWHHRSEDDKLRFNCKLCPYASNISSHFKAHLSVHDPTRKFACKICGPFSRLTCINCGKIFSAAATLSRHQIWHHKCADDIFKYNCSLCPYATNHTNRFKSHKLVHDPDRKYICKECGNGFTNTQSLKCHELIHTGEFNLDTMKRRFTHLMCTKCSKLFASKTTLVRHQLWHHKSLTDKFRYNCEKCPYATNTSSHFKGHYLMHDPSRKFVCEYCVDFKNCFPLPLIRTTYTACTVCDKWFSSGSTLNKHKVWHHKNLFPPFKYSCKHCPYATDNKTNFKTHFEVHSRDREFWCPTCGNGFKRIASLRSICKACNTWFISNSKLSKHKLWHHKSECPRYRFNCKLCPYASNVSSNLQAHEQVHLPDRPYECEYCGNRFKALSNLHSHVTIHAGFPISFK